MEKHERKSKWYQQLIDNFLAVDTPQNKIIEHRINQHLKSDEVKMMIKAHQYHTNRTAIQEKKTEMRWKYNSKIELGLFRKLVRQKVGYLLSNEPSITAEDAQTHDHLNTDVFTKETLKAIKSLGQEAIIKGIAYSIVHLNEDGDLRLYKVPTEQIIPFWSDERCIELDAFVRIYKIEIWEHGLPKERTQVEYWDTDGITYYLLDSGFLKLDPRFDGPQPHFFYFDQGATEVSGMNWDKVPLIAWRYNEDEESLLQQVESLIDNLSLQSSISADLLADVPNFIYILKNYGGTDLQEFMRNLDENRSVKVNEGGGVEKLQAELNTTAAEAEIRRTRKATYEAAAAIDTQDENLGNASGQALKWRYTDLDLDMNDMEAEFQQSIERFIWFVQQHADNNNVSLQLDTFKYVFNRDIIINEAEVIQSARDSVAILDDRTIRENHPWYTAEVESRIEKEKGRIEPRPQYDEFFEEKEVTEDGPEE